MKFKNEITEEEEAKKYIGQKYFEYWLDADNCDIQAECLEDVLPSPSFGEITEVYGVYYSPTYFAFKIWDRETEEYETHIFKNKKDAEAALKEAKLKEEQIDKE